MVEIVGRRAYQGPGHTASMLLHLPDLLWTHCGLEVYLRHKIRNMVHDREIHYEGVWTFNLTGYFEAGASA